MGAPRQSTHVLRAGAISGIAAWVAFLALIPCAHAGAFYYEVGGGIAHWDDAGAMYNGGSPSSGQYAVDADLFAAFGNEGPIEFQGGFLTRYTLGSDGSNSFTLLTLYPELRVQVNYFFLGGGVTPLLLREGGPGGSSSWEGPPSRLAYDAEFGALWPVVPIFSLGIATSAEWARTSAGSGPAPALTATVLMRFYFGFFGHGDSSSESHSSAEARGWRYPFGEWMGK